MKKIGKDVLLLNTSETNPRNGEGSFIRRNDGSIMYAYTEYVGDARTEYVDESWHDAAVARISAVFSYDEGETWGDKRILFEKDEQDANLMSVSLLRMKNGDIGIFYLINVFVNGCLNCNTAFRRSSDEGITWSEPMKYLGGEEYYVVNNDRMVRLQSGRIICPAATHELLDADHLDIPAPGEVVFIVSDDDGKTWKKLPHRIQSPFNDVCQLQEPGLYQHEDGTIWVWMRTIYGCQLQSFSKDNGETWSKIQPNMFFSSPDSPMQVKKAGKYTISIFNPIPRYTTRENDLLTWGRTPLVCAVSQNDGKGNNKEAFDKIYYIEDDLNNAFCYPAIFEGEDYFLAAYYQSEGTDVLLKSTKIKKVMYSELD